MSSAIAKPIDVEAWAADVQPAPHIQLAPATANTIAEPVGMETLTAEMLSVPLAPLANETEAIAEPAGVEALTADTPSPQVLLALLTAEATAEAAGVQAVTANIQRPPDVHPVADSQAIAPGTDARLTLAPIPAPEPPPISDLAVAGLSPSLSPAQRLHLSAKHRAKEETCLAEAIYFEARGETVRGQIAVAQVVINRVFSRFYPGGVCDVVYQNAHRRNACQFSFACNGKRKEIKDHRAWAVAHHIAALTLDGRVWEPDIGKATHYHAVWVNPWWVGTMHKLASHGVHIFYRPQRWGDGADEPNWSRVAQAQVASFN